MRIWYVLAPVGPSPMMDLLPSGRVTLTCGARPWRKFPSCVSTVSLITASPPSRATRKSSSSPEGPYRDGKGSLYEGSLRVEAITSWQGKIPTGVVTERIHVTDMHPTLLGSGGARVEQPKPVDGVDQWETMTGSKLSPRKELLLGMEDFRGALMVENWKLIVYSRLPVRYELYNVQDPPSEEDNHADREPQRVQDMLVRFKEYLGNGAVSLPRRPV